MRVLFTTTNWKGIYFCMVPLGWALQAAGHDVLLACAPSQAAAISAAGLTPAPVLEGFELMQVERMSRYAAAVRSPGDFDAVPPVHPVTGQAVGDYAEYDVLAHEEEFARRYRETLGRNCDAAVEFARSWRPSLVVHDLMTPEGVLAALATKVPSVYHSPGMFGSVEASLHDPTGAFPRHGVHGWDRSQIAYAIDPSPDRLAPDMGRALRMPVRYVPYNGPGAMEPWLLERPERPRVCMIWGNSASGIFGTQVPALRYAIDAVTAAGAELLLTTAPEQADALGDLPDGVRLLRDHPLHLLLPHCDAVIHQGSVNPMMTAAGLPQLILALTDDQVEIGRRFGRGGSSLLLPGLEATAQQTREAVSRLLTDDGLRAAARRVQSDIDSHPAVARLVPALEQLARTGTLTAADLPR
ncbi:nucleotide disphospho-sugar-binding domain-containing protein [Streptomyces sp. CoH27]|uniref:nucleotide disphospho-sugar-binding domain-containing protein n=1 Tax=Streptomyces sp. CoH27 TaxID=2875763 RepID=UPI001CD1CD40|nr:nucleotide disphospho-sugar-binding domain-containing protein [Streptomyces sp. CoH27]